MVNISTENLQIYQYFKCWCRWVYIHVSYTGWRLKKYEKHHAQNAMLSHFIWSTILPLKMDRTHKKDSECGTLISKGTWRDFSSILIFWWRTSYNRNQLSWFYSRTADASCLNINLELWGVSLKFLFSLGIREKTRGLAHTDICPSELLLPFLYPINNH